MSKDHCDLYGLHVFFAAQTLLCVPQCAMGAKSDGMAIKLLGAFPALDRRA